MKMNRLYWIFVLLGVGLTSCEEESPGSFEAINGIYLNNRLPNKTLVDSATLTFVYERADTLDVPVTVQLLGRPMAVARPVDIRVSSDNAVEGTDYVLPSVAEFPANSASFRYVITLKRTPVLKKESRSLLVEIRDNGYFTLPLAYELQANGDTTTTLSYRIIFSDTFTAPPAAWNDEDICGVFTQQKFELICRVLEMNPADFNDSQKVTYAKFAFIRAEMRAYVAAELEKANAGLAYDRDVLDRETGEPLEF